MDGWKADMATASRQFGAFAFFVGAICGVLYGIGGAIFDLFTVGWNTGTWLALNALWAMPFLALPIGVVGGALFSPLWRKLPQRWGGPAAATNDAP